MMTRKEKTEYQKRWYREHPEYQKRCIAISQESKHKYRALVLELLGGKCVHCGFSDFRALQVDHVNGDGYLELKANRKRPHNPHRRLKMIKAEPSRYQLLCANCNQIKKVENKEDCRHGK